MKTVALLFFLTFHVFSFAQQGEDEHILDIRKEYAAIRENMASYSKESLDFFDESTEGAEVAAYKEQGNTRLLTITWYGESGQHMTEYYYTNHQVFFVFDQETRYNRPIYYDQETVDEMGIEGDEPFDFDKSVYLENRYYFHNNKLKRWIRKKSTWM